MPSPYPLHGSGSGYFSSAVTGELVLRSIKNRSYFFIDFPSHFGSIFGPIWEPFGTLFGVKIDPNFVQVAFLSFIFFKNVIFTKPFKNQWILMIFQPKMGPKTIQNWPKTTPTRSQKRWFFMLNCCFNFGLFWAPFWLHFGTLLGSKIDPKSDQKSIEN